MSAGLADDLLGRADLGGAAWWHAVGQAGTPLCRALPDGQFELSFLWRDPDGGPERSDCQRVYLDVYSHTPHPTEALTSMARLGHSDVWLWQTRLPADWRGSYFLMPANSDQLPPAAPAARSALREWWIALMASKAQADPLNRHTPHKGSWGGPLSALCLPAAAGHAAWAARDALPQGRLLAQRWRSARLGRERDVWLYRSGPADIASNGAALPLVILLDGHYWARHMAVFGPLDAMTARGELPPALYLLVDALDPATRAMELPCQADFWLALQEELLPQLRAVQPFSERPGDTLVAGQSFGGLAALYAALRWPERFGMVLSQSGSFWWAQPDEAGGAGAAASADEHGDASAGGWLTRAVNAGLGAGGRLRVKLEVGCYEADMAAESRAMQAALRRAGHAADYAEYRGGHDWLCWRDGLLAGLDELLNSRT
ncbi:enterochelin esterase [Rugamonas sp. CCM 8940]|uniref:enterochelin esterase n=1 Tax=Rugamonas sp. CCM 8940 TaxID=2765359 RepID=UPI0018F29F75|nr:enterochelin esterase [Rugamonas sp. CCM 8940]MBJ7312287.1 enterochelin esterase [Rugamonas sp. CCM 8940]